jgi:hypothetical protein
MLSEEYCFPGLAEAGLIESRLSRRDAQLSANEDNSPFYFSPERYVLGESEYLVCGYYFPPSVAVQSSEFFAVVLYIFGEKTFLFLASA